MPDLPRRPPRRTEETGPFWDGCAEGRLVLPRCTACSELIWYPRRTCPFCGGRDVTWEPMSGDATLYSFTIIRRGGGAYKDVGPYVLASVELAEGPRLLTNVVVEDPFSVYVGQALRVRFEPAGDTDAIFRFEPA